MVYAFLCENFEGAGTLKEQLEKLYDSLGIELSTGGLDLIWKGCGTRLLSRM